MAIRYRAADRTLNDAEADAAHGRIVERLRRELGAELRG
jgi:phenylalanyl-tRNA synthetase beta chain